MVNDDKITYWIDSDTLEMVPFIAFVTSDHLRTLVCTAADTVESDGLLG